MNTTTKYSMNTYQDYAYMYYFGSTANEQSENADNEPQEVVTKAEDYSNTNLLGLPSGFKLNGYQ